jgi:actin-like ATPase involved in cell morphogenesis
VQKVEWFKLQLMLSGNTYIDPINLPPLPPGKSEIDVAADYLFKLRQAMRNQLQKTLGEVFNREERNIRYYLTVPAIWNDAGKAATRAAAIQAGFLRDENDNRLTLITEPEAAALFCAKAGLLNLKVQDAILIVDCGGGTVDLIAYEVEEESPFTVSECTAGSGDSCGSTALNRNFSNILRTKIRKMKLPDGSKTAGRVYAKCIMDFENRIKADFRNNNQKWAVDVGIEAEFPEAGIEEGYMTFTNEEILQCFEPVVNRILELVRNQIIAIQAQNRTLQNVLVVGGFGASEYLFQQIKLHVPPQFQSKVVRPMDSVAAIVKGAVTAGITERVVTQRVARRHYLMATLQPFKEGHHPEAYRVPSLDGKDRCKFTRQIFVQKGQRVKIGEPVKVSFFRQVAPGATLMYEDILYACDEDACPEYTKDPRKLSTFCPKIKINKVQASRKLSPSPQIFPARTWKRTLNEWIPHKAHSIVFTSTFTSLWTVPNSTLNWSAKERLWVVARRDLSDCIFLLQKKTLRISFFHIPGRSTADTKRADAIKMIDQFLMIAFWKWSERSICADLVVQGRFLD